MSTGSIVEVNKLKNIQVHLEKSITSILVNVKKYQELGEIVETLSNIQSNSGLDKKYLQSTIREITEALEIKKTTLSQKNFVANTDVKVFKSEMIEIQNNIRNLKCHVKLKLSVLQQEIDNLEEDVNLYSNKMIEWETKVKINEYHSISQYQQNATFIKHRVKEVQDFMDFLLKSNGHENGWRKEDHQTFVKFYNKYKDVDTLATNLNELLPDISIGEIKKHTEWYKTYLHFKKRKKTAILHWQKSKQSKKSLKSHNENFDVPKIIPGGESPETIQEKLQKWKADKEEQMRIARQMEEEKVMKQREKEDFRRRRNEEMKRVVKDWKQTKLEMEEQEGFRRKIMEETERKHRAMEANKMIKQFQSQDDMYVMKMREYKNKKSSEVPVRSKSSHVACRDPERLLQPTKQWTNRVHDDTIYNSTSSLTIPIRKLPKLGIPEWRRNIQNE